MQQSLHAQVDIVLDTGLRILSLCAEWLEGHKPIMNLRAHRKHDHMNKPCNEMMSELSTKSPIPHVRTDHAFHHCSQEHSRSNSGRLKATRPLESLAESLQRVLHTATFGEGKVCNQHISISGLCNFVKKCTPSFTSPSGNSPKRRSPDLPASCVFFLLAGNLSM